jgi:hypothetical protein
MRFVNNTDFVEEMKEYALNHPFDADKAMEQRGDSLVDENCFRTVNYKGKELSVVFSYNQYPSLGINTWHLSLPKDLDDVLKEELAVLFLGNRFFSLDNDSIPIEDLRTLSQYYTVEKYL